MGYRSFKTVLRKLSGGGGVLKVGGRLPQWPILYRLTYKSNWHHIAPAGLMNSRSLDYGRKYTQHDETWHSISGKRPHCPARGRPTYCLRRPLRLTSSSEFTRHDNGTSEIAANVITLKKKKTVSIFIGNKQIKIGLWRGRDSMQQYIE